MQQQFNISVPEPVEAARPEYIWELVHIFNFFDEINELISAKIDTEVTGGNALKEKISTLTTYFTSSVQVLASCSWYKEAAYKYEYERVYNRIKEAQNGLQPLSAELKNFTSASVLKDYLKSRTADFIALHLQAERTNAALTHTIEAMRTLLSAIKTERQIDSYSNQK